MSYSVQGSDVSSHLPNVIFYQQDLHLLMMEDLGHVEDLTSIYASRQISQETISKLIEIAHRTHSSEAQVNFPPNLELRKLNHQHIFVLAAASYQTDNQLTSMIHTLGEGYLSTGTHLIHGDYYPRSRRSSCSIQIR